MYKIFPGFILLAAMAELGFTLADFKDCRSRACLVRIERRSREVIRVTWKPISVFPKEARRFR